MSEPVPEDQKATAPDPRGWPFWRKRLGRGLIVGALALTAAQILPALPEDQIVRVQAPSGVRLTRATLTYYSQGDSEPLMGTELVPTAPAPQLTHTLRVPRGDYTVGVKAVGADRDGKEQAFLLTRTVTLEGATATIALRSSSSGP